VNYLRIFNVSGEKDRYSSYRSNAKYAAWKLGQISENFVVVGGIVYPKTRGDHGVFSA